MRTSLRLALGTCAISIAFATTVPVHAQPTDTPVADAAISAETLVGTWNADFARSMAENHAMSEEERAMAMAFVGMIQMSVTFADGGTMTITLDATGESEIGTYVVSNVSGNSITISATPPSDEAGTAGATETMVLLFEGANVFKMADEAIYFNRVQ
jgi:hypothetical protein